MTVANRRKKQPDVVRQQLLSCAAQLLVEVGVGGVTVQAVAAAAGVTKGGLLHHFPSKQRLLAAVSDELLREFDAAIDEALARDPVARGRFTRAYVRATLGFDLLARPNLHSALSLSTLTESGLRRQWGEWLHARLLRHRDTDSDPALQLARYAADGVYLAMVMGQDGERPLDREGLLARMLELTLAPSTSGAP